MNIGKANLGRLLFNEHDDASATGGAGAQSDLSASAENINTTEGASAASAENADANLEGNATTADLPAADDFDTRFQSRLVEIAKEKGLEVTSVDDLFKKPEPVEVVKNPYENVDPNVKAFLDYHTQTNRTYEDFLALQKDVSTIPDIDLARDRVRQETGNTNLTNSEIDQYLEKKLNIDLSDPSELDIADKIELSSYAKAMRESRIAEQEKYRQPIDKNPSTPTQNPVLEANMVELENGERMPKEVYEAMVASRQKYIEGIKTSVDSIAKSTFKVTIDDNGSEKTIDYGYDYSAEDKQNMLSNANDLEATITKLFKNEQTNSLNHADLVEGMFWVDKNNREKAIAALIHKVRADVTESLLKEKGNVNLSQGEGLNNIPGTTSGKSNQFGPQRGFGVKVPINIPKN